MRSPQEITADIAKQKDKLNAPQPDMTVSQREELMAGIEKLQQELQSVLTNGAIKCPGCGTMPHGMIKTPAVRDLAGNIVAPELYEIGCLSCKPRAEDNIVILPFTRGPHLPSVIKLWNDGSRWKKLKN